MRDRGFNPFKVGDKVQFVPNERAQGWSWFETGTIQPNDIGIITRIKDRNLIFMTRVGTTEESLEVGGFDWECFRKAD